MGISTVLIFMMLVILLLPWIISILLRIFLFKYVKSISASGYFSFKNIVIHAGLNKIIIEKLSIVPNNSKILITVDGAAVDLHPAESRRPRPMSALKMMGTRLLVSAIGSVVIFKLTSANIKYLNFKLTVQGLLNNIELNQNTGELIFVIFLAKALIYSPDVNFNIKTSQIEFKFPGLISFKEAFENSTINIKIGSVHGNINSVPQTLNSSQEKGIAPRSVYLNICKVKLEVLELKVDCFSVYFCLNPLAFSVSLIKGSNASIQTLHIPDLQVFEDEFKVIKVSTKYIGVCIGQVLPVILKFVRNNSESSEKLNKTVMVNVDRIECRIQADKETSIDLDYLKIEADNNLELIIDSICISNILKITQLNVSINSGINLSFESAKIHLDENIIKELVGFIAETIDILPPSKPSNSPEKLVKLNFSNIELQGDYPDGFKILVLVSKFSAKILPKNFDLYFYNSKIYDLEGTKHHVITTITCKVHKEYKNSIAQIEVLGDGIEIFLPRQYYLTRAVIKFLKGSHKIYKWSKLAILKVHKPSTYIPETSQLHFIFTNFEFLAEDNKIDSVQIKKYQINPNSDVYTQLKSINPVPLLTLKCKQAEVDLNNLELNTLEKIYKVMNDIDEFQVPGAEFFGLILAYDMSCIGKSVEVRIRDYPYKFCEIEKIVFGGRTILSKNRLLMPVWAEYKHHYDMEVQCINISNIVGISQVKVLMDVLSVLRKLFYVRSSQPGIKKIEVIDFFRYFLQGSMRVIVKNCSNLLLSTASPYTLEGFDIGISECLIIIKPKTIEINCIKTTFSQGINSKILSIPITSIFIEAQIKSKNPNHWITKYVPAGMFDDFSSEEINTDIAVSLSPYDENKLTVIYEIEESSTLINLLSLLATPPVTLIPVRKNSPANFFKNFKELNLSSLKVNKAEIFLLQDSFQGACLEFFSVQLSAHCELQKNILLIPWEVKVAEGTCSEISIFQCSNQEKMNENLLDCMSIEYKYSLLENHYINIDGFKLSINYFLIALATQIAVSRPADANKIFKKAREKKKWSKVKIKKFSSSVIMRGVINAPQIALVDQETDCKLVTIGGVGEFEVVEENLKYDVSHKDIKRKSKFSMQSIECYIDDGLEITDRSMILSSKNMEINLVYFSYPFSYIDYAHNCIAVDSSLWYKEKRINKLQIELPDVAASIESEEFWTLIDIIKGFIGYIPQKNISISDILMQDEFKAHGGKELVKIFHENMKKNILARPNESQELKVNLENLSLQLKRNSLPIIDIVLSGVKGLITNFTDSSCQKSFEIHKISINHGNTEMISPLLIGSEEYLLSNTMLTLRLLDRWVKGSETLWPVIDHLEFLVFPLTINFSKEIYKDLYAFFFCEEKSKSKTKNQRIKLPRLYKYIHLNEIKICITVTGWIPLNNAKILIKPFTRQNKFKSVQGVFDKIMKHGLNNIILQVPSVCMQYMGIKKKNFIPTADPTQKSLGFLEKLKKKKTGDKLSDQELQKIEGMKIMFGKNFK